MQNTNLARLIAIAAARHADQFDKGGRPYILHVMAVMYLTDTDCDEVKQIAAGHDLVEDTNTTYQELLDLGFSKRVVDGIRALTKVRGETQEEYEAKVMANKDARLVKMADLRHNSDITRLKGVTEKDVQRIQKYMKFYTKLKAYND